jgi:hypothetical protein
MLQEEIQNCEIFDLGGTGDCVFKACAHSLVRYQGKTVQGESLIREAARLRVMAVQEVSKNPVDPQEQAHHRGGIATAAQDFDEYLLQAAKQNFYGDGFLIQAMATKLKRDIVVWDWKQNDEYWQRFHIPGGGKKEPLLVDLKNEHYRAILLPKDEPCPDAWLAPQKPDRVRLRGAGKSVLSLNDSVLSLDTAESALSRGTKTSRKKSVLSLPRKQQSVRDSRSSKRCRVGRNNPDAKSGPNSVLDLPSNSGGPKTTQGKKSRHGKPTEATDRDLLSSLGEPDFPKNQGRKRLYGKQKVHEWHEPPDAAPVTWQCPLCDISHYKVRPNRLDVVNVTMFKPDTPRPITKSSFPNQRSPKSLLQPLSLRNNAVGNAPFVRLDFRAFPNVTHTLLFNTTVKLFTLRLMLKLGKASKSQSGPKV